MTLPPPEICQRILALHLLLGFPDGQDEKRLELLKLLGECGLGWNSLPEFFADMKVNTVTPLPVVDFQRLEETLSKGLPVARCDRFIGQRWPGCTQETY